MKIIDKILNLIIPKEDDSHEFKPILAEIEDSPINPIGNTMFWVIIVFMVLAAAWMYFGKVDIVVTARGLIIPTGEEYGILNGIVTVVSPNSIKDEQLGDIYEVYIKPQNTTLMVEGKEQTIKYGMTTTNEIKIGKRRIIEFFIYPLIKYMDESIKVR